MKSSQRRFKILAYLDIRHAASREMMAGILRFASTHHDLEVQFSGGQLSETPLDFYRAWEPDALITDQVCHELSQRDFTALAGKATVYVNTRHRDGSRRPMALITTDERSLAMTAANLFLSRKLVNFGYVGMPEKWKWSVARERLFKAALKDHGHQVRVFAGKAACDWRAEEQQLSQYLKGLPKPCGVWAACDWRAKQVLDACRVAGIDVPGQVQVLGVDNETFICEQTIPSLSSLSPDFEAGGFSAAEFLYAALEGRQVPQRTILAFPIKGAVERLSTTDINGSSRRVAAAREFIRRHATSGISVPDVARSLGVCVRLIEKNFKAVTGRTVAEEIQSARLDKAKELLRKTTIPIGNIGSFCGFDSPSHLKTLFRKTFGMTMSEFRNS